MPNTPTFRRESSLAASVRAGLAAAIERERRAQRAQRQRFEAIDAALRAAVRRELQAVSVASKAPAS